MSGHIALYLLNDADDRTALFAGGILLFAFIVTLVICGYEWHEARRQKDNKKTEH